MEARRLFGFKRSIMLCQKAKVVIHVANNDRNRANLSTDLRIYIKGDLQKDRIKCAGKLKWCEC